VPKGEGRKTEGGEMIEEIKTFGVTLVFCDEPGCRAEISIEGFEECFPFEDISREIAERGWREVKDGGEYYHYCPNHREGK
jgi:hypothetical protein